ncbi:protein phosphatase CheZ [Polycladidibacter hongkongensis]|uniref:protein phosphatase CheZ n=1 Tax=Polycladidibacter hongkongensis TaxID=1647556 RepID=UPI0008354F7F|nr:protein phosphatase CheZ [Pseudovibrio hongkongensis]
MTIGNKYEIQRVIEFLQENKDRTAEVNLSDIMRLTEVMAATVSRMLEQVQPAVTAELTAIESEISNMKDEIARLRVADMKHDRIPQAGRELDAIVSSTEEATHSIMAAAETIMAADPEDAAAYQETVNDQVMEIFQACAFQDITGQRISKVVGTLNFIDERVSNFINRLRLHQAEGHDAEETEEERRARELILHGPQHAGEGVSQDEIDAMLGAFGSTDKGNDAAAQDDIDKLFA